MPRVGVPNEAPRSGQISPLTVLNQWLSARMHTRVRFPPPPPVFKNKAPLAQASGALFLNTCFELGSNPRPARTSGVSREFELRSSEPANAFAHAGAKASRGFEPHSGEPASDLAPPGARAFRFG